jgi:hypothetical protein
MAKDSKRHVFFADAFRSETVDLVAEEHLEGKVSIPSRLIPQSYTESNGERVVLPKDGGLRFPTRKLVKRTYKITNADGTFYTRDVTHDVTPQVLPVGEIQPLPMPSEKEANEMVAQEKLDSLKRLCYLDDRSPELHQRALQGAFLQILAGVPPAPPTPPPGPISMQVPPPPEPTTQEAALQALASYIGGEVKDGEVFDAQGTIIRVADHLGALVSNLDGTEQFIDRVRMVAKHPKFIFRNRLDDVRADLTVASKLLQEFPWNFASEKPQEAITDLRQARDLIDRAIAALTGVGSEVLPKRGAYPDDEPTVLRPLGTDVIKSVHTWSGPRNEIVGDDGRGL